MGQWHLKLLHRDRGRDGGGGRGRGGGEGTAGDRSIDSNGNTIQEETDPSDQDESFNLLIQDGKLDMDYIRNGMMLLEKVIQSNAPEKEEAEEDLRYIRRKLVQVGEREEGGVERESRVE